MRKKLNKLDKEEDKIVQTLKIKQQIRLNTITPKNRNSYEKSHSLN
jgi:hypothetical protein